MIGLKTIAGFILILLLSACEDFQSETYDIDRTDARACTIISDTTLKVINTRSLAQINNRWSYDQLADSTQTAVDTLIRRDAMVMALDSCYNFITDEAVDTSYLALSGNGNPLVIYLNDYLNIAVFDKSGNELSASDNTMAPELVGGCVEQIEDKYKPLIKTRLEYQTQADNYLLRIIKIDQTEKSRFRTALVNKQ